MQLKPVLTVEADKIQIHKIISNSHSAIKKNRVSREREVERPTGDKAEGGISEGS